MGERWVDLRRENKGLSWKSGVFQVTQTDSRSTHGGSYYVLEASLNDRFLR